MSRIVALCLPHGKQIFIIERLNEKGEVVEVSPAYPYGTSTDLIHRLRMNKFSHLVREWMASKDYTPNSAEKINALWQQASE